MTSRMPAPFRRRAVLRLVGFTACSVAAATAGIGIAAPALAHERRVVGPYLFVVGFHVEPAYVGEKNAISLRVRRAGTNEPVEGVEKSLKARIAFDGGLPRELPLHPWAGVTGGYLADVIPTRVGSYRFQFAGSISAPPVEEEFESGPGRFSDVEVADKLQFPEVVVAPAMVALQARRAEERASALEVAVDQTKVQALGAQAWGTAGPVAGVVGIAVGGLGLERGRRA